VRSGRDGNRGDIASLDYGQRLLGNQVIVGAGLPEHHGIVESYTTADLLWRPLNVSHG